MIHLNIKSCYSFFYSDLNINKIVNNAIKHNENYVAIIDKNVMFSYYELDELCKKNSLTPIFGVEIKLNYLDNIHSLCLIALNDQGYKNLCKLSSIVSKSRSVVTTIEEIKELGNGLVAIIPSVSGPFINDLNLNDLHFNNYIYT